MFLEQHFNIYIVEFLVVIFFSTMISLLWISTHTSKEDDHFYLYGYAPAQEHLPLGSLNLKFRETLSWSL